MGLWWNALLIWAERLLAEVAGGLAWECKTLHISAVRGQVKKSKTWVVAQY